MERMNYYSRLIILNTAVSWLAGGGGGFIFCFFFS